MQLNFEGPKQLFIWKGKFVLIQDGKIFQNLKSSPGTGKLFPSWLYPACQKAEENPPVKFITIVNSLSVRSWSEFLQGRQSGKGSLFICNLNKFDLESLTHNV